MSSAKDCIENHNRENGSFTLRDMVNGGFASLHLSLGDKLGLFEAFRHRDAPISSRELAERSNCKDRYVREWLYAMTACSFLDIFQKESEHTFSMKPWFRDILDEEESKVWLYRAQAVSQMGAAVEEATTYFRTDGSPGFTPEAANSTQISLQKQRQLYLKDLINDIMRKIPTLEESFESGLMFCDIGGGQGHLVHMLGAAYPRSQFVSVDVSDKSTSIAQSKAQMLFLANATFFTADACSLPQSWDSKYDFVTMVYVIHNVPDPARCASEAFRVLKTNGSLAVVYLNIDSNLTTAVQKDKAPFLFSASVFYSLPMGIQQGQYKGNGLCFGNEVLFKTLTQAGFSVQAYSTIMEDTMFLCTKK